MQKTSWFRPYQEDDSDSWDLYGLTISSVKIHCITPMSPFLVGDYWYWNWDNLQETWLSFVSLSYNFWNTEKKKKKCSASHDFLKDMVSFSKWEGKKYAKNPACSLIYHLQLVSSLPSCVLKRKQKTEET